MIYDVKPNCEEPKCPECGKGLYQHENDMCLRRWWIASHIARGYSPLSALQRTYDPLISITFSHNDVSEAEFSFGDSNCHQTKQYDPDDGHGSTTIKVNDDYDQSRGIGYLTEWPETVYMKILILFNVIKGQPRMFWARDYPSPIRPSTIKPPPPVAEKSVSPLPPSVQNP